MSFSFINEFIVAILIGITQGLTEFLPISSTAHLDLLSRLLLNGSDFGLSASNIIQFGTTLALLIYFKKDLKPIFSQLVKISTNPSDFNNWLSDTKTWWKIQSKSLFHVPKVNSSIFTNKFKENLLITQLILGTIPIAIMGLLLQKYVDNNMRLPGFVAIFLALGAGLLILAENLSKKFNVESSEKNINELNPLTLTKDQVILIGVFQSLAIFPGMSRSGSTISGSLLVGLNRPQAARFAFLVGIPALLLSSIKDFVEILLKAIPQFHFLPDERFWTTSKVDFSLSAILVATLLSFIVGYSCLKWLINYISKTDTRYFSYYRLFLSLVILLWIVLSGVFR